MKHQGLCLILGESFRTGAQNSRVRGLPESVPEQEEACRSHVELFQGFANTVDFEMQILTYTTPFDHKLADWYGEYRPEITTLPSPIGYDNLFQQALSLARSHEKLTDFNFIFIFRIDLILKDKFQKVFDPSSRAVRYPSVCWARDCRLPNGRLRVNDMFVFVPKERFTELFNGQILLNHNACQNMPVDLYDQIEFFLDTYHDSDSHKDRNPLYKLANRPEEKIWHSEGYRVGRDGPIRDESKTRSNVFGE